jgi:hypothetical protein
MRKNSVKELAVVAIMLVLVCFGYTIFYNNAFTGHEAQGAHIWLSASTVKFVNNWLKEGPLNLRFIMYEFPDSIEFNSIAERGAYISYPPGAIIPPYILAKLLHKSEIQIGFIKQFLKIKFLFDTLMVSLIVYSIFRRILQLKERVMAALVSIVLAISWMCLPINLYYLRNIYFSDQCIISVVLFFVLLEIYDDYFSKKSTKALLRYIYFVLKFLISLYGVLTDYYFLFVLFISWLVKIVPILKATKRIKNAVLASFVYVLPVLSGISLFVLQITTVPDWGNIITNKMKYRMFSSEDWHGGNKIVGIVKSFIANYSLDTLLIAALIILFVYTFVKQRKYETFFSKYKALFSVMLIIYVPPVLQILVFQQHSAIHEFSMLKFALPVTLGSLILSVLILELKMMSSNAVFVINIENGDDLRKLTIPVLPSCVIIISVLMCGLISMNGYYFSSRMGEPVSFERENLIRANYNFNDVYFSFTESIDANPPQYLAVSKKLIYKIDDASEIYQNFPNLKTGARILLIINTQDTKKPPRILENERNAIQGADILFSSEHYTVYGIYSTSESSL